MIEDLNPENFDGYPRLFAINAPNATADELEFEPVRRDFRVTGIYFEASYAADIPNPTNPTQIITVTKHFRPDALLQDSIDVAFRTAKGDLFFAEANSRFVNIFQIERMMQGQFYRTLLIAKGDRLRMKVKHSTAENAAPLCKFPINGSCLVSGYYVD